MKTDRRLIQNKIEDLTEDERIIDVLEELLSFERKSQQGVSTRYMQEYKAIIEDHFED